MNMIMAGSYMMVIIFGVSVSSVTSKGVSLAFVFDTTGSMSDELRQAQSGATRILNAALDNPQNILHDFILVPFNDPAVGPTTKTTDRADFERSLASIGVTGGDDCHEMAVGGIKEALIAALPRSLIYVFTDAAAKDNHLTDEVIEIIQEKQSKVTFVMTGDCGSKSDPGYTCYQRIARASSGEVFTVEKGQVGTILDTLIETTIPKPPKTGGNTGKPVTENTTAVAPTVVYGEVSVAFLSYDKGNQTNNYPLPIDSQLADVTLSLTGDNLNLDVYDPSGKLFDTSDYRVITDLPRVYIIKFDRPQAGKWTISFRSSSYHTLKVTGSSIIDFDQRFGVSEFSSDFNTLFLRPLAGIPVHTFIQGVGMDGGVTFTELDFLTADGKILSHFLLNQSASLPDVYVSNPKTPPTSLFYSRVAGFDRNGYPLVRVSKSGLLEVSTTGIEQCVRCAPGGTSRCIVLGKVDLKNVANTKYRCECIAPYFEGDGLTCRNVDECATLKDNCDCNADCTDTFGSFYCNCKPGFAGNGTICTNIDECALPTDACQGTGTCSDLVGSFHCNCSQGYLASNRTAPLCEDIDECSLSLDTCSPKHTCVNTNGSYVCTCKPGFTGNSTYCENINECADAVLNLCDENSRCDDTIGGYTCACNTGYTGNGYNCTDIDECASNTTNNCDTNAVCVNSEGNYTCYCNKGFTGDGTNCTDIDECESLKDDCDPKHGVCTNTEGGHICSCIYGFTGEFNCTEVKPNVTDLGEREKYLSNSAAVFRMYALEAERQSLETLHENLLRQCALIAKVPTRGKRAVLSMPYPTIDRKQVNSLIQSLQVALAKLKADVASIKQSCGLP